MDSECRDIPAARPRPVCRCHDRRELDPELRRVTHLLVPCTSHDSVRVVHAANRSLFCFFFFSLLFISFCCFDVRYGVFWMYACIGIVGCAWLARYMPETKGKSLEDIVKVGRHDLDTQAEQRSARDPTRWVWWCVTLVSLVSCLMGASCA